MIDAKRFTDLFNRAAACSPDITSALACAIASYNEEASNAATGQGLSDAQYVIEGLNASIAIGSDKEWVSIRRHARDRAIALINDLLSSSGPTDMDAVDDGIYYYLLNKINGEMKEQK